MGLRVEVTEPKDRPKDGGNPGGSQATGKSKKKDKKKTKEQIRREKLRKRIEKGEPDQGMMDFQAKEDAKEQESKSKMKGGGLVLKVTNRGPMHRSNNRKS